MEQTRVVTTVWLSKEARKEEKYYLMVKHIDEHVSKSDLVSAKLHRYIHRSPAQYTHPAMSGPLSVQIGHLKPFEDRYPTAAYGSAH